MVRGRFTGFTLIEFMISVAILAIVFSISVHSLVRYRGIHRDRSFSESIEQAPQQMSALRAEEFEALPPEVAVVGQDGRIQLSQTHLVEGTLKARTLDGTTELDVSSHSSDDGSLTLKSATSGTKVLVDYAFHVPRQNESHFLDS